MVSQTQHGEAQRFLWAALDPEVQPWQAQGQGDGMEQVGGNMPHEGRRARNGGENEILEN